MNNALESSLQVIKHRHIQHFLFILIAEETLHNSKRNSNILGTEFMFYLRYLIPLAGVISFPFIYFNDAFAIF